MDAKQANDFVDWLEAEMAARRWRPVDLAEVAGIYQASLSKILRRERGVGADVATDIAKALGYPPDYVFRRAGLLPRIPDEVDGEPSEAYRVQAAWILDIMKSLTEDERQHLIDYALMIFRRGDRAAGEPPKPEPADVANWATIQIDRNKIRELAWLFEQLATEANKANSPA